MHMDIGSCSQLRMSLVFGVSTWPPHGVGIKMACPNIESTEVYSSDQRTCCPKCLDPPPSHPPPLPALCFHSLWLVVFFSLIYLNRFINDLVSFVNHQQFGVDTSSHTHSLTHTITCANLQSANQLFCSRFLGFSRSRQSFQPRKNFESTFSCVIFTIQQSATLTPIGTNKERCVSQSSSSPYRAVHQLWYVFSPFSSIFCHVATTPDRSSKQRSDANTSQHSPLSTVSLPANPSISSTAATSNSKVPPPPPSSTT